MAISAPTLHRITRHAAALAAAVVLSALMHWGLARGTVGLEGLKSKGDHSGSALFGLPRDRPGPKRTGPMRLRNLAKRDPARSKPPDLKNKEPEIAQLKGQIVDVAKPVAERAPADAKYLAQYDSTVDKETKARYHKQTGPQGVARLDDRADVQDPDSKHRDKAEAPQEVAGLGDGRPSGDAAPRGGGAVSGRTGLGPAPGKPGSVLLGDGRGLILPGTSAGNTARNLQTLAGSPGGDDYLPDVEDEGELNRLNTRKFKYWDFFNRVKERVREHWSPGDVWLRRDPSGKVYGVRDRLTILKVTLDAAGELRRVQVQRESGVGFLDDEAERAFRAAQPFPNPPVGLRSSEGEVTFQFGFMFEISSSRFRTFWRNM